MQPAKRGSAVTGLLYGTCAPSEVVVELMRTEGGAGEGCPSWVHLYFCLHADGDFASGRARWEPAPGGWLQGFECAQVALFPHAPTRSSLNANPLFWDGPDSDAVARSLREVCQWCVLERFGLSVNGEAALSMHIKLKRENGSYVACEPGWLDGPYDVDATQAVPGSGSIG